MDVELHPVPSLLGGFVRHASGTFAVLAGGVNLRVIAGHGPLGAGSRHSSDAVKDGMLPKKRIW